MASGDVGGACTELVITCRTPHELHDPIEKGDPVRLIGPYTVEVCIDSKPLPIFGQALQDQFEPNAPLAVRVRGICIFTYLPYRKGAEVGEKVCAHAGIVHEADSGHCAAQCGLVLKVDKETNEIHVLL